MNTQCISNKIDNIEVFLSEFNPDILCVTEHWCCDIKMRSIKLQDFNLIDKFCRLDSKNGGAATYCRNDVKSKRNANTGIYNVETVFESSSCIVEHQYLKIGILNVYRPPIGCFQTFITCLPLALGALYHDCDYLVLCGDLNVELLKQSNRLNYLTDILESFNMYCTIKAPTRIATNVRGTRTASAIDCVATNLPKEHLNCFSVQANIADHLAQVLNIKVTEPVRDPISTSGRKSRNITDESLNELNFRLRTNDWSTMYEQNNVNCAWSEFMDVIGWCFEVSCPYKTYNDSSHKAGVAAWIDGALVQSSRSLRELYWLKSQLRDEDLDAWYLHRKKEHNKLVANTKRNYYSHKINNSENRSKAVWKIVNEKTKNEVNPKGKIPTININGTLINDPQMICEEFASYFSTIAKNNIASTLGDKRSTGPVPMGAVQKSFFFHPVSIAELESIIKSLRPKRSNGPDEISNYVLKNIGNSINEQVCHLMNMSLMSGEFPTCLREALVLPVFKKGDTFSLENYRPIALISTFSKIMEKVVCTQLTGFLETQKAISERQHGFRRARSTESALTELLQGIYDRIDAQQYVAGIFFDLTRAFDCVDPQILCHKLEGLGIRGVPLDWIRTYLNCRSIRVKVGDKLSKSSPVELGVVQGSVLGPLLFLLFTNDLPQIFADALTVMYADDTSVIITANSPEQLRGLIDSTVISMQAWCDRNRLLLNMDKTKIVHFHKRREIQPQHIQLSDSVVVLGVHIDDRLTFSSHIEYVCSKLNSAYYALYRLTSMMDRNDLVSVYYALVQSVLSYNVIVWGQATDWKRVFIAQKRVIRLLFKLSHRDSCREVFKMNGILTFPALYIFKCATLFYDRRSTYEKHTNRHCHSTRRAHDYVMPQHRTSTFRKSPEFACVTIYNKLPELIKQEKTLLQFKRKLKHHLTNIAPYCLEEFLSSK